MEEDHNKTETNSQKRKENNEKGQPKTKRLRGPLGRRNKHMQRVLGPKFHFLLSFRFYFCVCLCFYSLSISLSVRLSFSPPDFLPFLRFSVCWGPAPFLLLSVRLLKMDLHRVLPSFTEFLRVLPSFT